MTGGKSAAPDRFWSWILGFNLIFWPLLFFAGIPGPCTDDMFFTGTAVNLLHDGVYRNPWIEPWNKILQSGRFFFQPPFHAYTLAPWLKVFGLSTASLLAFQNFWAFVFSVSAAGLMRRFGAPLAACLAVAPLFAITNHLAGFRPDILGFAYLALGLWLYSFNRPVSSFVGAALVFASVLTLTIFVAYAVPLLLALFWIRHKNGGGDAKQLLKSGVVTLVLPGLLVTLLFLICIEFKLGLFIHDYLYHASLRRPPTGSAAVYFVRYVFEYWGPVQLAPSFALFVIASIGIWFWRKPSPDVRVLLIASFIAAAINILLYPSSAVSYVFFLGWIWLLCAMPLLFRPGFNWVGASLASLAMLILLVSQTTNIIGFIGQKPAEESKYADIRKYVQDHPDRVYAIDTVAAYYVFQYRFPAHITGWGELRPPTERPVQSVTEKDPNMSWVASTVWLNRLISDGNFDSPKLTIFGRKFGSLPETPADVTLIP